jgi:iron-sulfur cluster assembly protein
MATSEKNIVKVTDSAINQADKLLKQDTENEFLRVAVKGGGCSGLSYDLKFDNKKPEDYIQKCKSSDETLDLQILIDPKSALYLKDMTIDFDDGLMGKGFTFTNPNASNTCGCGESFSVF